MAEQIVQNQLNFNLNVPLAASKLAVRYHKPNPIIVERAGGLMPMNVQPNEHVQTERQPANISHSSAMDEKMALAVQLARRDLKRQKEKIIAEPGNKNKFSAPKHVESKFSKVGTRIIQTREARERAARLEQKRAARDPLRVREQGWNSGTAVTRDKTPPRRTRFDLPATTNSPPTRDTDHYPMSRPSSMPMDNPGQEIERLQKEIEHYLQQIQVIEQRAMTDNLADLGPQSKSRKKDGYLSDEEDQARKAIRMEEQAVRVTRQLYNLRQQVRALQDQMTRGDKVKHTKKSQVMLRLAAAHRGAVRAIQSFVNQQLPQQDLRQGLPACYKELALLIRQLVMISTQIKGNQDTEPIHKDLLRMLDRVDELNKAWCKERAELSRQENLQADQSQMTFAVPSQPDVQVPRGRPVGKKRLGKENKPKGLLKKQIYKGSTRAKPQPTAKHRQVTPERQGVLRAGLEALMREKIHSKQNNDDRTPNFSRNETDLSEPAETSLILSKPLQQKRAMAQKGGVLAVPETHYADPTLASSLKTVQQEDVNLNLSSQEPWRPAGSVGRSPSRSRSKERSRSYERNRSRERIGSLEKYRSHSPQSYRQAANQQLDTELMLGLFPHGVDGQSRRGRSASPRSRSQRPRSRSPPRNIPSRATAERLRSNLKRMDHGAQDVAMSMERQRDLSEIHMRQLLADRAIEKAEVDGDMISDMILNDILYDTVTEMQSMEDGTRVSQRAAAALQNPTLENLYQRLEEMELEQQEIRRRWGSFQFEEESSRKKVVAQQPVGPLAMEITKHGPSQSVKVQDTRSFHKERHTPIIFTKTAPPVINQEHTVYPLTEDGMRFEPAISMLYRRGQEKFKLRIPETVVKSIKRNVDIYERHLKKTSHASQGKFDPWKLVEEISDQILDECLHEIDQELDDIGENIVHQVCKSEFAIPEPQPAESKREILDDGVEDFGNDNQFESSNQKEMRFELTHQNGDKFEMTNQNVDFKFQTEEEVYLGELPSPIYEDDRPTFFASVEEKEIDKEKSRSEMKSSNGEKTGTSQKKEVSFSHEIGYEREAIFDAADLDTARDIPEQEDDEYDDDEDDDDDDVEQVSPIDSDDLEYSTDEA